MEVVTDNTQALHNALERIKELEAHCERSKDLLREAIALFEDTISGDYKPVFFTVHPYAAWLNETPRQSLAAIQREAIEKMLENVGICSIFDGFEQNPMVYTHDIKQYAEQLTKSLTC